MLINMRRIVASLVALCGVSASVVAAPVDFEAFTDGTPLVNEVPGLVVGGGTILSAGIGLNEFDYPPSSGVNVLGALTGSMTLDFINATAVSAFFVAADTISITAFDDLDQLLASYSTPFGANLGSPQLFDFSFAGASRYSLVSSSAFVVDDLSFVASGAGGSVPEPSTLALVVLTLPALLAASRPVRRVR